MVGIRMRQCACVRIVWVHHHHADRCDFYINAPTTADIEWANHDDYSGSPIYDSRSKYGATITSQFAYIPFACSNQKRERSERWKTEHSSGQMTFQSKWNEKECHALMSTHTEKKHTHKFCIWLCGENTRRTKQTKETEEQNGRVMHVVLLY